VPSATHHVPTSLAGADGARRGTGRLLGTPRYARRRAHGVGPGAWGAWHMLRGAWLVARDAWRSLSTARRGAARHGTARRGTARHGTAQHGAERGVGLGGVG